MDNIEIYPVQEMERLEAMYKHYKNLYRKLILLCCSNEKKLPNATEMNINTN